MSTLINTLSTPTQRENFITEQVIPYIKKMPYEELHNVAFDPKTPEQELCNSEALIVLKAADRLTEFSRYRSLIRDVMDSRFSDWQAELAIEIQSVALSIVLSDLVGETFIGGDWAYDYDGIEIEVTETMIDTITQSWDKFTSIEI